MLTKIKNYTYKSFNNYTVPDSIPFKMRNIVFGYNGKGKSSLASGIVKEFIDTTNNANDKYRFFNVEYIKENLMLEDGIKGIKANFSKKDVDIEKRIKDLESKIVGTTTIDKEISDIVKVVHAKSDEIYDNISHGYVNKKHQHIFDLNKYYKYFNDDYNNALNIAGNDSAIEKSESTQQFEEQIKNIQNINYPVIPRFSLDELERVNKIMASEYFDLEIPSSEILLWIENGLKIHSDGEKCKFCGNELNINKIKENFTKYKENRKVKDMAFLGDFRTKLASLNEIKTQLIDTQKLHQAFIGMQNDADFSSIFNEIDFLLTSLHEIDEKINNFDAKAQLKNKDIMFEKISKVDKLVGALKNTNNKEILNLQTKISSLDKLIKGKIGLNIIKNDLIIEKMKTYNEKIKEKTQIEEADNKIKSEIVKLKLETSDIGDFANFLNHTLEDLEIEFKLVVDSTKDTYLLQHKSNKQIKVSDISEGEKNLLALLFFLYELYEDADLSKIKDSIELIVIDDPISSVDDTNKVFILTSIQNLLKLDCDTQIFVLTHIWEDVGEIAYNKYNDDAYMFYEVKKDNNGNSFLTKTNPKHSPYKHDFMEILDFIQNADTSNFNECQIYHIPNVMRKIIEHFASFKVPNNSPTIGNVGSMKSAFETPNNRLSTHDESRLKTLLNVCNIYSHKTTQNPEEVLKSAKFLMRRIQEIDPVHYCNMAQ